MTLEKLHTKCAGCGIWWYEFDGVVVDMDNRWWCPHCAADIGADVAYGSGRCQENEREVDSGT